MNDEIKGDTATVCEAKGFGRLPAADPRDKEYPVKKLLLQRPGKPPRPYRNWNADGWWGDQGSTSHCVGYAWTAWYFDGPIVHKQKTLTLAEQLGNRGIGVKGETIAEMIYRKAQQVDEWPGEGYAGTSVRAGAKVLQATGAIKEYRWATTLQEVVDTLLQLGPMVVGTDWMSGMMQPDSSGLVKATGSALGGHAYILDGVNRTTRLLRIKNSWGRGWGRRGFANISFDDFERLLSDGGEACIAIEVAS